VLINEYLLRSSNKVYNMPLKINMGSNVSRHVDPPSWKYISQRGTHPLIQASPFTFTFELTLMGEVELEAMLNLDYIGHRRSWNEIGIEWTESEGDMRTYQVQTDLSCCYTSVGPPHCPTREDTEHSLNRWADLQKQTQQDMNDVTHVMYNRLNTCTQSLVALAMSIRFAKVFQSTSPKLWYLKSKNMC